MREKLYSLQTLTLFAFLFTTAATTSAFFASNKIIHPTLKLSRHLSKKYIADYIIPSFYLEAKKKIDHDDISGEDALKIDDVEGNDEEDEKSLTEDEISTPNFPQSFTLQPIGHVSSIYRLCVGTPRQGNA